MILCSWGVTTARLGPVAAGSISTCPLLQYLRFVSSSPPNKPAAAAAVAVATVAAANPAPADSV